MNQQTKNDDGLNNKNTINKEQQQQILRKTSQNYNLVPTIAYFQSLPYKSYESKILIQKSTPDLKIEMTYKKQKRRSYKRIYQQICVDKWQKISMNQLAPYIRYWLHDQKLDLFSNHYSKLFNEIKDINFPYLKYMNIWGNNIQSIQGIQRVYWPNLQKICLWNNQIVSLRPFRRIYAVKLNWLDLKNNNIVDFHVLSQFYNPSKKYGRIHVSCNGFFNQFFKIEGQMFEDVNLQYNKDFEIKDFKDNLQPNLKDTNQHISIFKRRNMLK